jgi:hypothetical protein
MEETGLRRRGGRQGLGGITSVDAPDRSEPPVSLEKDDEFMTELVSA